MLTGQIGDVMRESMQAALSLVKTRAESLGIKPVEFTENDIHVHVPSGGVPKDGPSAGCGDVHGAGVALRGPQGAQRRGDDRRDHVAAASCCPSVG